MALGEAFVEVRADLRPFRRDLQRELQTITQEFERQLNRSITNISRHAGEGLRALGDSAGQGIESGIRRRMGGGNQPLWVAIAGALAGALDDGISALPMEVKAALVAGILAVSPIIAGALAGLIAAAVGAAFAGVGVALASQFESVETSATRVFRSIRVQAVQAAGAFEAATLQALAILETRFPATAARLERILTHAARFVEPLVMGTLNAIDLILAAVESNIGDIEPFVQELASSLQMLALAIGAALSILVSTGKDGRSALRDLTAILAGLVVGTAVLVKGLSMVWGMIRNIGNAVNNMPWFIQILTPHLALLGAVTNQIDQTTTATEGYLDANVGLNDALTGVVGKTEAEKKALKEAQTALENMADATLDSLSANIDFEASLDELAETLKRNGDNLDINTKKGRENVKAFISGINDAEAAAKKRVATGEMTAQQSLALYDQEIARLKEVGRQLGVTDSEFQALFGHAIELNRLAIAPDHTGLDAAAMSAQELAKWLQESINLARHLSTTIAGGALAGARRPSGFSDGSIVDTPTFAMLGEGFQREVVIPLTKPARAAELAQQSGLTRMLGGDTQVMVFIGSEQLEAKMVKVVQRNNTSQASALNNGTRRF